MISLYVPPLTFPGKSVGVQISIAMYAFILLVLLPKHTDNIYIESCVFA